MSELVRLHAVVRGYVQGVNFRWYTRRRAGDLGVRGWVRNDPDGSVEVMAEGRREAVQELLDWLHHGPPLAEVNQVQVSWQSPTNEFSTFEVYD